MPFLNTARCAAVLMRLAMLVKRMTKEGSVGQLVSDVGKRSAGCRSHDSLGDRSLAR